jgi:hypothetical protein
MVRCVGAGIGLLVVGLSVGAAASPPASTARAHCDKGRQALIEDRTEEAITLLQQSLQEDPDLADAHLSLAAAFLGQNRDALAASHLEDYLRLQPDHHEVRRQYAEVLLRLGRRAEAYEELERFLAAIQDNPRLSAGHLVSCHTRLMEIASARGDDYGEHLHRGIALYRLACASSAVPAPCDELSQESLLCRAAAELTQAHQDRPDEARPCWYLSAVRSRLAQPQAAGRWLRAAQATALLSYLTPSEQRDLALAGMDLDQRRPKPCQRGSALECFPGKGGVGPSH